MWDFGIFQYIPLHAQHLYIPVEQLHLMSIDFKMKSNIVSESDSIPGTSHSKEWLLRALHLFSAIIQNFANNLNPEFIFIID